MKTNLTTRKRKKTEGGYKYVPETKKLKLLDLVNNSSMMQKQAAEALNIKYSTAKSIIRSFRALHKVKLMKRRYRHKKKFFKVMKSETSSEYGISKETNHQPLSVDCSRDDKSLLIVQKETCIYFGLKLILGLQIMSNAQALLSLQRLYCLLFN